LNRRRNWTKHLFWLALSATIFGMVFSESKTNVKAVESGIGLAEQNAGLDAAPENLGLDTSMFTVGDLKGYINSKGKQANNLAMLLDASGNTTGPLKAIRMTYNTGQSTSIWSNVEGGNYIDIGKKQTMSMWMYFGPQQHTNITDEFGDGMAFVLQNSDDKTKAFTHKGNNIGAGETLGVWGMDNDGAVSSAADIAKTAIQKSWALEFDSHGNTSGTPDTSDSFDMGLNDSHIAYGYPGDADTYTRYGSAPYTLPFVGTRFGGYYYTMKHDDYQPVTLHDGQWHHLTISWNPDTYKISYKFNDKNRDGTKGLSPIARETKALKASEFGEIKDNKLRWGFTATTGAAYQANLIAFESIPAQAEGTAGATIKDNTQNKDVESGNSVNSGDSLSMNYKLTYDSGRDLWSGINAHLVLPENVTYNADTDGNIGKVVYSDGTSEPIKASELTEVKGIKNVNHVLGRSLYSSDPATENELKTATITINGTADNVDKNTNVLSASSRIDSTVLILNADTPDFVIKKSRPINLKMEKTSVSVAPNKETNLTGLVTYTDGSSVTGKDIKIFAKINGTDLATTDIGSVDDSGNLKLNIPYDKLTSETNTVEIYVKDADGNISTKSTVKITKAGSLALKVDNYSFGDINQANASQLISRKGNWDILVSDSRTDGTSAPWHLSAQTNGLHSGDTDFNGFMVYKDTSGIEKPISGDSAVEIANGYKTESGEQVTNVGKAWHDADGIMLKLTGLSQVGNYEAEVNWTLSDTI